MRFRRPTHPARVAIVVGGLILAANLGALAIGGTDTDPPGGSRPSSIEAVFPEDGTVVRRQETVGVDLRAGLTGVLTVHDVRIPEDQYRVDPGLGLVQWQPGPGQELTALPEGTVTASVTYWPIELTEDAARAARRTGSYTWRFTVAA